MGLQFLLCFFFGPLGLFYSNVAAAIGLILGAVLTLLILRGAAPLVWLIIWLTSIGFGLSSVEKHNKSIKHN